jgi:hydrogenase-4 component B
MMQWCQSDSCLSRACCSFRSSRSLAAVTQYSADSFAQPIRRVLGEVAYSVVETLDMPRPGDPRAARFTVVTKDRIWDVLYAPIVAVIGFLSKHLNHLQFLTIRSYLSLVFAALVGLLSVVAIWP